MLPKKPKFKGLYSRKNLPKIKDGAYVINLDEYKSKGTHWIAIFVKSDARVIPLNYKKGITITYAF